MINIAICDDDVPMTATIESFLLRIGKEQNIKIDCEVFLTDRPLWKVFVREHAMI